MHPVIVVCLGLVLVGVAAALRWGGLAWTVPWPTGEADDDRPGAAEWVRRLLWYLDVHLLAGIVTGLLVIGPGGRLVMRLLAATAGDAAQGRETEAQETVGVITVGGSIGFVVFVGLFGGLLVAAYAAALRPWMPTGRARAGVLFVAMFVTMATRLDPLRPDNLDFGIVGPDWLSVASFSALGVVTALTFEAVAARLASAVPMLSARPGPILLHAPLLLLGPTGAVVLLVPLALAVALVGSRASARRAAWNPKVVVGGRIVLAMALIVLLPVAVGDVLEIL